MKKRMLITTIVMVLVVAIALTTSSLAWFTMSASVSISEVAFGAVRTEGAEILVSKLDRLNWGTSAEIGTGLPLTPVQGDPTLGLGGAGVMTLPTGTYVDSGKYQINFDDGTWYEASDVTSTPVGGQTANQLVELVEVASNKEAYFVGGFNIRNDGTNEAKQAKVEINGELKVGVPHLISGEGALPVYAYGDLRAAEYEGEVVDDKNPANYKPNDSDKALAGAIRVAVFTRTWTYTSGAGYVDSATVTCHGVYAFSNYKVTWNNGWEVATGEETTLDPAGVSNALYVSAPVTDSIYSKNGNLADEGCQVIATNEDIIAQVGDYDDDGVPKTYFKTKGLGNELDPIDNVYLAAIDDGEYSGIEVVVVAWLDGWDDECLPIAGGGRVSLAFTVDSSTVPAVPAAE
jgi:hypothetical protein